MIQEKTISKKSSPNLHINSLRVWHITRLTEQMTALKSSFTPNMLPEEYLTLLTNWQSIQAYAKQHSLEYLFLEGTLDYPNLAQVSKWDIATAKQFFEVVFNQFQANLESYVEDTDKLISYFNGELNEYPKATNLHALFDNRHWVNGVVGSMLTRCTSPQYIESYTTIKQTLNYLIDIYTRPSLAV